jgi:hypothetical protein
MCILENLCMAKLSGIWILTISVLLNSVDHSIFLIHNHMDPNYVFVKSEVRGRKETILIDLLSNGWSVYILYISADIFSTFLQVTCHTRLKTFLSIDNIVILNSSQVSGLTGTPFSWLPVGCPYIYIYIYTLPPFSCVAIGPHCALFREICGQLYLRHSEELPNNHSEREECLFNDDYMSTEY